MSSRLYSMDALPEELAPIRWRMATQTETSNGPSAAAPGTHTSPSASHYFSEAPSQVELEDAYQRGLAEGRQQAEASAMQMAHQQIAPVMQTFSSMAREMSTSGERIRSENEAAMVRLSIAIAKRILHREIQTDPEAILGLIRSAFDRLNARETHKLRVAPSDAHLLAQHRSALLLPEALEIAGDPALSPGSAVFETTRGELDASAATQLDEIGRGFADLVRRRNHHGGS